MSRGRDHEPLADLEHRLQMEDPKFVDMFRADWADAATERGRRRCFSTAIVLTILVAVCFVLVGQPSVAVLCCLVAGVLAVLRVRYCAHRPL